MIPIKLNFNDLKVVLKLVNIDMNLFGANVKWLFIERE